MSTEESRRAEARGALRPGHRLKLLKGGAALFPALVEAIDGARADELEDVGLEHDLGAA